MPTVVLAEDILRDCIDALRPVADYELEPALERRLNDLGERKEFLTQEEHAELLDLVEFARRRSAEKLKAQLALHRLEGVATELTDTP
jgi:predicted house-cleaning noncanonical NTP pyrophosphatase (MazG superfamily)